MKPTTLYPSKLKWIGVTAIGLVFVAIGIWMVKSGEGWIAWLCLVFFVLVALAGITQLLPGMAYLRLDEEGFEFKSLWRKWRYSWGDIQGFTTWRTAGNNFVGFETGAQGKMADVNRHISGANQGLPDTYGMKPDALIALMVQYADAYWERQNSGVDQSDV